MKKHWHMLPCPEEQAALLAAELKIHPVLCRLLVQRGHLSFEQARLFFRPDLAALHSPWLMKDMDKAVQRVQRAFTAGERILVYGDYDVDGTTAVATVYSFLRSFYPHVEFYIPHRYREGYGLSAEGIRYAQSRGITLLITLDCGIKATGRIGHARSLGIDTIVCDHHLPDTCLPPAVAILNPKQADCPYPYPELSGCGIGFKFISALAEKNNIPREEVLRYLDLVATSIAADIVPLTGENRILTYYGLKKVNEDPLPGLQALIRSGGLKKRLCARDLVFMIAPRVNAAGRMDDARTAVKLFIEKDPEKADGYAAMLHHHNTERRETDTVITREALQLLDDSPEKVRKTTVLFRPHWHKGVVGIVASRLIETYYRPTILLTASDGKVAGSARSVAGFNIYEALHQCRDLLEDYGGHFYAAGMTLKPENVPAFRERFEEVVAASIDPALLIPRISIDAEIRLADITGRFYHIIRQFGPFGPQNLPPVFVARNVTNTGFSRIVRNDHIRFELVQDGSPRISGIGFNMAHKFDILAGGRPFDVCFTLDENEWNGRRFVQLKVIDINVPL